MRYVPLDQDTGIARRIRENALAARRRIRNARPKQIEAKPPSIAGQDILNKYRVQEWNPCQEQEMDAHVIAYYRRQFSADRGEECLPSIQELRASFMTICPVSWTDICSDRRSFEIVRWRQAFMEAALRITKRGLLQIGRGVGGKDHTTVLHADRKVRAEREAGRTSTHTTADGHAFHVRNAARQRQA